ncbi:MAG: lipoprotein-releasing system permease protein [Polyangiales bacterium]|jgi:lipoprotein-releasing system permease protein
MLALKLAFRFLREGMTQSLLILSGVTVGIAAYVFVSALMTGLGANLVERTLGTQAHIVISPDEEEPRSLMEGPELFARQVQAAEPTRRPFDQWQRTLARVESSGLTTAVCPKVIGPIIMSRGGAEQGGLLVGADAARLRGIIDFPSYMERGVYRLGSDDALIGDGLAETLGLSVGQLLRVRSGERETSFRVAGIFHLGNAGVDDSWVVSSLRNAQTLLDRVGDVSAIDIRVEEPFEAEAIATRLSERTGLEAESWMSRNQQLLIALESQSRSSQMINIFVLLAVAMGIASVLVVSVVQRQGQIGILRAIGTSRRTVLGIFLWQGALLGISGAFLGILLGWLVARWMGSFILFEITVSWSLILSALAISVMTGVLAAILPARSAARMDPAAAIRGDA